MLLEKLAKETAVNLGAAEVAFDKAWREFYNTIPNLEMSRFWEILPHYRNEVFSYVLVRKDRQGGVEKAAWEFFRKPYVTQLDGGRATEYTVQEALSFAVTYADVTDKLYKPLFNVVKDRGDDAYGDLLDSLPLVGQVQIEKCLGKSYGNYKRFLGGIKTEISEVVVESFPTKGDPEICLRVDGYTEKMTKFILSGENYNKMFLNDAAKKCFKMLANDAVCAL